MLFRSQLAFSGENFSVEHIIPRFRGGNSSAGNLALACQGCNNHKFTRTEALDEMTGRMTRLFHPRNDRWPEHFEWSADATELLGLTSLGRATVVALHLNRAGLIAQRAVLAALELHPPV